MDKNELHPIHQEQFNQMRAITSQQQFEAWFNFCKMLAQYPIEQWREVGIAYKEQLQKAEAE